MNAKIESQIIEYSKKIIEEYKNKLKKNICIEIPTISRYLKNGKYSSEITMNVKDDNGIFDVLEFFVYKNNELLLKSDEYKEYINDFIEGFMK